MDRGKRGIKRSVVVDGGGIPLRAIAAAASRHDSPLRDRTRDTTKVLGGLPERTSVHLDRGYDSRTVRERIQERGLVAEISEKGKPAPIAATRRWVVERTNPWGNAHKKLAWCAERVGSVVDFWLAFSAVSITVRRLVREGRIRYRWKGRPRRRP